MFFSSATIASPASSIVAVVSPSRSVGTTVIRRTLAENAPAATSLPFFARASVIALQHSTPVSQLCTAEMLVLPLPSSTTLAAAMKFETPVLAEPPPPE